MLAEPELATSALRTSLTGWQWQLREADARQVAALMQKFDLPEIVARILVGRCITLDDTEAFLNPSLKAALPDPSHLLDMDKAAARVAKAIMNGERIAIFGDYDVDGATSSALLARYLRAVGCDPIIYIPDRMKEGYGPNAPALLALHKQGAKLAITVDCGTLSFEPLQAAHEAGLDVIVVDHHMGEARKPAAYAIVNPNRLDETSPHRQLAAVGVAFLLLVALNRKLRESGFFTARAEPDLKQWLDIVALGTICDVVPLTGLNRALVAQGLKVMGARGNLGMRTIFDVTSIDEKPGTYHAGFVLGPRINAGGRVGKSDLGVRLLITEDPAEALMLAQELDKHNSERKAIESLVIEQAFAQAEANLTAGPVLMVTGNSWHPGVIGIVAGRLKERFHMPAAVIAISEGIGKASARSVPGFDIGAAVIAAREQGLLIAGGGHAMAAGFTVAEDKIPALSAFMASRALAALGSSVRPKMLKIDAELSLAGVTAELAELLEKLGPFGSGHPQLKMIIRNAVCVNPSIVGKDHVRVILTDRLSNARLSAIAFRAAQSKLGEALLSMQGKAVDIAACISPREWQGKKMVNVQIEDIALPG